MRDKLIAAWPLYFGIAMIMVGNGLQGTLLGVRATIEGFDVTTTGLIMSFYYGGYLIGPFFVPKLIRSVGHIRVFAALASLASTVVLLHGVFGNPWFWGVARMVTGFSYAGLYIVIESWLNDISTAKIRGKILGLYMVINYGGLVTGQYLLNLANPAQIELFILTSILVSLALLPIALSNRPAPDFARPSSIDLKALLKISPLGFFGVFISGFGASIFFTMGPVFASSQGMSLPQISNFMAAFIAGGLLGQIPLGFFVDRVERRRILMFLSVMAGFLCFFSSFFIGSGSMLYVILLLAGSASLTIYAVSSAYTNDHVGPEDFVPVSAALITANGIGAFCGPFIASLFMHVAGPVAFFYVLATVFLGLFVFAVYRARVRPAPATVEEQGPHVSMALRPTPVMSQIMQEEWEDQIERQAAD